MYMYCACLSLLTYTLLRVYYIVCMGVLMRVYYSHCIPIMSNICDRTDTCTCTYYFIVKFIGLCIVCVVV